MTSVHSIIGPAHSNRSTRRASLKAASAAITAISLAGSAAATVIVNSVPTTGTMRASQLWQDPGPNGDDLDGDAVCWTDFTVNAVTPISHLEWWGTGACEKGFRIEIWKQDPGTIAYQPYGVFYYGGVPTAQPLLTFDTTAVVTSPGPNGTTHYVLDLAAPLMVPANNATNPRWFIDIVGLTSIPYAQWLWARGTGASNKSFQFIRGEGPQFWSLGEGRALLLSNSVVACPADLNADGSVNGGDLGVLLAQWGGPGSADLNGSGTVDGADLGLLIAAWGNCQ